MWTRVGANNHVLDGDPDRPCKGPNLREKRGPVVKYMDCLPPCAKTAAPIKMPFGIWTPVVSRKHVLDGGAYWHNLANTTEPSMYGGDAALRQITSTTCLLLSRVASMGETIIMSVITHLHVSAWYVWRNKTARASLSHARTPAVEAHRPVAPSQPLRSACRATTTPSHRR